MANDFGQAIALILMGVCYGSIGAGFVLLIAAIRKRRRVR